VRLLQGFVRIPSITGDEGPFARAVEGAFREAGLLVETLEATPVKVAPYLERVGEQARYEGRPNVIGRRTGRGRGRSILLNAHIDTVGAETPQHRRTTFSGVVKGG
jgi:acetylornithine deacetylase